MASKNWNVLSWNIRGINHRNKWDALRQKIEESACAIVCIQGNKRESFDMRYIRQFAPNRFDAFDFIPSVGSSGGILMIWNTTIFKGAVTEKLPFVITVNLTSMHNLST
ncbi:hypothetical protein BS78_K109800 [Paspalum vaginatum]|uniref:Endonuclease/exonuclease/phosphatase domain-containing protein n=1 Tax=Paspalum vaginatum TaxID=158149 RepID=A0A9W8CFV3_9POAL|nr:hypothetical protein BS78_K109800 [Paspalum vaginatum]